MDGLIASDAIAGGFTVRFADWETPCKVAVISQEACVATGIVWAVKLTVLAPAATLTEEGTVANGLLPARLTTAPLAPEGPESVIVPVAGFPPRTASGLIVSDTIVAGVTVRIAVAVFPPDVAEITT